MIERIQLPNKVERLSLITDWVDNFVHLVEELTPHSSRQPVEAVVPSNHMLILDMVPASDSDLQDLGFLGAVIYKRAAYLELPLTVAALLALTYLSERPGDAVMYLTVLKHLFVAEQIEGMPVRLTYAMVKRTFPVPPSRPFLDRRWDGQKWHGVNLVDLMGPHDFLLTAEEAVSLADKEDH
jgi:hypothetical protein